VSTTGALARSGFTYSNEGPLATDTARAENPDPYDSGSVRSYSCTDSGDRETDGRPVRPLSACERPDARLDFIGIDEYDCAHYPDTLVLPLPIRTEEPGLTWAGSSHWQIARFSLRYYSDRARSVND